MGRSLHGVAILRIVRGVQAEQVIADDHEVSFVSRSAECLMPPASWFITLAEPLRATRRAANLEVIGFLPRVPSGVASIRGCCMLERPPRSR